MAIVLSFATSVAAGTPRAFPKRAGGPSVMFDGSAVLAAGATPGATVYFAGVSLSSVDYMLRAERTAASAIAATDGTAKFVTPLPSRSVWIVVDGQKDGYTVNSPPGMLLREMDFPGKGVQENAGGQVRKLLFNRYSLDVFLIRPGSGIWAGDVKDGGPADEDRRVDGSTMADLDSLKPLDPSQGPLDRFRPGDYLFIVDRNTLEFHVLRRGQQ